MKKAFCSVGTVALLLFALGFSAVSKDKPTAGAKDDQGDKYQINIDNFSFTPPTLTVPVGTKVTWVNHDDVPHTVVSVDKRFNHSPVLDTDERFSTSFTSQGTYEYYCSVHPKMTGKIIVR